MYTFQLKTWTGCSSTVIPLADLKSVSLDYLYSQNIQSTSLEFETKHKIKSINIKFVWYIMSQKFARLWDSKNSKR